MTSVGVRANASMRWAERIKLWCSDESGTVKASRSQKYMSGIGVDAEIGLGTGEALPQLPLHQPSFFVCVYDFLCLSRTTGTEPTAHTGLAEHHQWYLLHGSVVT